MSILDDAQALARSGRSAEAVALIEAAAARGDGEASFAIANWRLHGINGAVDPAEAHLHLLRAVLAGYRPAIHLRAGLLACGVGVVPDPAAARALLIGIAGDDGDAARQIALLDAMPPPAAMRWIAKPIVTDPVVTTIEGLLVPDECDFLIASASPHLAPSHIVDPATRRRVPHPFRTSQGMNFGPSRLSAALCAITTRIAEASDTTPEQGEPLQLLRYRPGEEYRPHLDALPAAANQRDWTMLIWLNEAYDGGETEFPALDMRFRGRRGDALLFRNVTPAGIADQRSRHAGRPVTRGEKWLATRWIRRHPFVPWQPEQQR